ncbi:MAG: hypothetical protein DRO12_05440 [Thermoprotei archaeon]|nr:MAG: hypothetical protein DRO12_05440 [Thermoprotei archaeon]
MLTKIASSSSSGGKLYRKSVPALTALVLGFAIRILLPQDPIDTSVKHIDLIVTNSFYSSFIVVGDALKMVNLVFARIFNLIYTLISTVLALLTPISIAVAIVVATML